MIDRETLPYRPAAGIMLLNREAKVFVAQRLDSSLEAWQMPQGGLDEGEDPQAGALRELEEETGIRSELVEILARAPAELYYDLPDDLLGKIWKGRYRGQKQKWYAIRFTGKDSEINIVSPAGHKPEFVKWRWEPMKNLPGLVVPFKRPVYERVVEEFSRFAGK